MALPSLIGAQRDFSAGQITETAARRDDLKLYRSGLKRSVNTRALAAGGVAQRFGRSTYNLDTGRTEIVRITDTLKFEFLFGDGTLSVRDDDGNLLNDFAGLPWTLDTLDEIVMALAEREVFVTYRNNRPKHLRLGAVSTLSLNEGVAFGDALANLSYPTVAATNTSYNGWPVSFHSVALPSGIEPGDLLIVVFSSQAAVTPTGWTLIASQSDSQGGTYVFAKVASGIEGAALTVATSSAVYSAHNSYRITEASGSVEGSFVGSASFDPPSLSPSWGSTLNLWLAIASLRQTNNAISAAPSGYSDLIGAASNSFSSSAQHSRVSSAWKQSTASSENPGAFTVSSPYAEPKGATVAIEPSEEEEIGKAFDGFTNKAASLCAAKASATSCLIGLDLSAAPQSCAGATVYGSNDKGFVTGATPNVTITLYGKNGAEPTLASPGTSLGSTGPTADTSNESAGRSIVSSDAATEYDYLAVVVAHAGSAATMNIAQVAFSVPSAGVSEDNWLISPFKFETTPEGAKRQPYVRYADRGIVMTCSARSGTGIDVTFSGAVLSSEHVGVSLRFHDREIVITSVTDPLTGTANVIEKLPPTRRVVCDTANGRDSFKIGQVVIGETSGAEGLVVAFNSTTGLDIIVYQGDNYIASERIASPSGAASISGTPTEITLAGSEVWDEAAMSDYRGWPRSVEYDRSRLVLCDFPQSPRAIAWTAIGAPRDFYVGADPDSAFFEFAPGNGRVLHVIGGSDQYVLTDIGVMYIPISESNPLQPGSVTFRPIAAIGAGAVRPVTMHEGIVYVAANLKSLVAIVPTGQTAFPYRTAAIAEFHSDLFTEVRCLAAMAGGGTEAEQYLWVGQTDGTALVGKFDSSNEWVGFVPVTGDGLVRWISALGGDVRFNVQYQDDDSELPWAMEQLDEGQYLDGGVTLNSSSPPLRPTPDDSSGRLWFYAGLDVDLMNGTTYLGARAVDENGDLVEEDGDDFTDTDIVAGFGFTVTIEPWIANQGEGDDRGQRLRRRRVKKAMAVVRDTTQFTFMGRTFGGMTPADGSYRANGQKRSFDPSVPLVKTMPGPLTLLELDAEVTT